MRGAQAMVGNQSSASCFVTVAKRTIPGNDFWGFGDADHSVSWGGPATSFGTLTSATSVRGAQIKALVAAGVTGLGSGNNVVLYLAGTLPATFLRSVISQDNSGVIRKQDFTSCDNMTINGVAVTTFGFMSVFPQAWGDSSVGLSRYAIFSY